MKMDNYETAEQKREIQYSLLRKNKVNPRVNSEKFCNPIDARLVRMCYIGWYRNAWYHTRASTFFPNSVNFSLDNIKDRAEDLRTAGSKLYIRTTDALWLNFGDANLMIIQINKPWTRYHKRTLENIRQNDISEFCQSTIDNDNLGLYFELPVWRPDLIGKKKPEIHLAGYLSSRHSIQWTPKPIKLCGNFRSFCEELVKKSLGRKCIDRLDEFIDDEEWAYD